MRRCVVISALAWACTLADLPFSVSTALAEDGESASETSGKSEEASASDAEPPSSPPRPVPNYDGRPDPPPGARERLLWVPRVIFFPVYFTTNYLVRAPLGFALHRAEKEEIPRKMLNFFRFGEDDRALWLPTVFYDFGFKPSVGAMVRVQDVGVPGHSVSVQFSTWGIDWLSGSVTESYSPPGADWRLDLLVGARRRPDGLYFGIGGDISRELESRFQFDDIRGRFGFDSGELWRESRIRAHQRVRYMDFSNDVCCGPSIAERVDQGLFPQPPGFPGGYLVLQQRLELVLDTRRERPARGSGWRTSAYGGYSFDLQSPQSRQWISYGGEVGAFVDLTGRNTVLDLTLTARAVEALQGEVPFTELVAISGRGPLVGFIGRRLIGSSGGALVAEYRWPIWLWLDGSLHFGVGNVFADRFDDFDFEELRMSWGIGVRSSQKRGGTFSVLVAFGTTTFADGASVESFRFLFGGTRGF